VASIITLTPMHVYLVIKVVYHAIWTMHLKNLFAQSAQAHTQHCMGTVSRLHVLALSTMI
jgi:hypothetical protein